MGISAEREVHLATVLGLFYAVIYVFTCFCLFTLSIIASVDRACARASYLAIKQYQCLTVHDIPRPIFIVGVASSTPRCKSSRRTVAVKKACAVHRRRKCCW
ncbi:uncharacterized protein PHACADRAFT_248992 [Phanerochaete carnosa HHB-10118-sp]|uniref:Uncharacterized protein n=1 Tax=Phanerochaete carnosa (strain HHB-10118-sp) TaxID=650164 RepID=K5WIG6_PHACS|nr:uncharacterized protein PHACADRAFT_248992 [Phanerochaete carnosa HHB-10118-sp]EKM58884.1 hypothetical protein PHACADRAFT_248992 [Phanerochaete carnosa HHB-10118-sp]